MPIKLSELMAGRCERLVAFGEEALAVTYRPYSEADEEAILGVHGGIWTNGAVRAFLSDVVIAWDLLGDDGKPVPTDEAALKGISMDILAPIWLDVRNSINPPTTTSAKKKSS